MSSAHLRSLRVRPTWPRLLTAVLLAGAVTLGDGSLISGARAAGDANWYRPELKPSESLQPFLPHLTPGSDAFPEEGDAAALEATLSELGRRLKMNPEDAAAGDWLLAPGFRGGRLLPSEPRSVTRNGSLEISRSDSLSPDLALDARSFAAELKRLVDDLKQVAVAEFLVTAIADQREQRLATIEVRYDLVGPGRAAWRVERLGTWRMRWRRDQSGWRVLEWTARSYLESVARSPVFTEVTSAVLGANESFRRQLGTSLDAWMATLDSVLTRDSNGHHGVSVGDADGDGLDDLYLAQPSGLPNRLYRARGDGTFEDVTEAAGLAVLDDTAESLFADVDNDGDEDLVLATGTKPLLFLNDGKGHFTNVPDAFRFARPLQGSLTSIAMADYDRDGFLDLYLCVYSYFYGAGEDKAGTPMPYYDARTGPPGVLFRNDGRGHFVDATEEAGLEAGNDHYHFAAAWADYDGDGWPDLLVANDFGTKNLYRNRGRKDGKVTFEEVAGAAGVLDHGAGMSATFLDYDNDGRLDIYTGNMWSPVGLRVTSEPGFMPDATPEVRGLYARHARGNSLFRNRGDGRFEDVSLPARAALGRWAWSSDALDFDSDGWDDLYVVNGMLTRERARSDLESFFWRQVVARSPQARITGTPYDDAWRAINQLLVHDSIASHQRNVLLRNDGRGGFDEVAGAVGLDLDQDGRSFAVLDLDRDGDPDLAVMAARQTPQLRIFRNDFEGRGAALAIRLLGTASNRDAIGARVTVKTDARLRTRVVQAGSGFLSQHSKELLIGLGPSQRVLELTVEWPSGRKQVFTDVPLDHRLRLEEGGELRKEPFATGGANQEARPGGARTAITVASQTESSAVGPPSASWLYEPFPAPDFTLPDLQGRQRSLQALKGRPAVLLLWSAEGAAGRAAFEALARGGDALARAGIGSVAIALDASSDIAKVRKVAGAAPVPVVVATREVALIYAILNRHLFMNRQDLRLPTAFLLDAEGSVVKAYLDRVDAVAIRADVPRIEASPAERLARALPFRGTLYSPPGRRNYLPYGHELLDQGLEAAALVAFERAAQASPSASTLYRLGTLLIKTGEAGRAREAFERALALQPDFAEANNDLGALLARQGDLSGAVARFRTALQSAPDYPDALNNLGYALLLSGREQEARGLYEKALELQPDFPEALNNLGLLFGRAGELDRAEPYFRKALERRDDYAEAANNLALVLVGRGQSDAAVELLRAFLTRHPASEATYLALAKVYVSMDRRGEAQQVLEQLLQKDPSHALAREILAQLRAPSR
jgi:Flp pilus assembly protein TadD/peroxiredoxin